MTTKKEPVKKDGVIILGTASTLPLTPWNTNDFDFWACAPAITHAPVKENIDKISAVFEMHPFDYWITIVDRLNSIKVPVYMQNKEIKIKNSVAYPLQDVQNMVTMECDRMQRYFTSTISYMIALAIKMGYKRIHLYGVHMSSGEEYGDQRQACESWLAYAAGKGIETWVPEQSEIFRCPYMYGYEQQNNIVVKVRHKKQALENGLNKLREDIDNAQKNLDEQMGAIKMCRQLEREYT